MHPGGLVVVEGGSVVGNELDLTISKQLKLNPPLRMVVSMKSVLSLEHFDDSN